MKHMHLEVATRQGFALPTVLIASVIMLIILVSSISAIGSVSVAIDGQFYNQLAREAAEAGVARAADCMKQSPTSTPQWTNAAPLTPKTNCDGTINPAYGSYIVNSGNIRTSFSVGLPATGSADATRIAANGSVSLVRTSNSTAIWRTYSQSLSQDSRYRKQPKIAGGAGWLNIGHIAAIMTVDNQVYGFGYNSNGQVTDSSSPASVVFPLQYALPAGVTSVTKVRTSGQGASFICILGNNAQLYCRGDGLGVYNTTWTQMNLPAGLTVSDFWLDGYGKDTACVLASNQQAYCAGEDDNGSLGNGVSTYTVYSLNNPQRFAVPAGVNLKKIVTGSHITCGITTESPSRMFCAGRNDAGQIGGPGAGPYATPIAWPIPGFGRGVKDVIMSYHTMDDSPAVHALLTDGTIWSTGNFAYGDLGNGLNSGSTGTSQSPELFNTPANGGAWQTGVSFKNPNSGRCIDNQWGNTNNGNTIQLYDCNQTDDQAFIYGSNKQLSFVGNGKCLDDPGNNPNPGTALQLYDCNGTAAQQFNFTTDINGNPIIKHISSGLCVDLTGAGTANGVVVELWTCNNGVAQVFNQIGTPTGWTAMITGADAFCGIRNDTWSGMWCAGQNNWGQLLNYSQPGTFFNPCASTGTTYSLFNVNLPNGTKVDASKLSDEWRQQFQSLQVIATDGKVYGSGRDQYGKFGTGVVGDAANDYRVCKTYNSLATMQADQPGAAGATSTSFALPAGVVAMDMSTRDQFTTYVLGSDNRIYVAGRNVNGQVGDGTTTDRLSPVQVKLPRQAVNY